MQNLPKNWLGRKGRLEGSPFSSHTAPIFFSLNYSVPVNSIIPHSKRRSPTHLAHWNNLLAGWQRSFQEVFCLIIKQYTHQLLLLQQGKVGIGQVERPGGSCTFAHCARLKQDKHDYHPN